MKRWWPCHGLNAYDHVFHGSHVGALAHMMSRADAVPDYKWFVQGMEAVRRGEYEALRGIWREQEAYFQARSIEASSQGPLLKR